MSTRPGRMIEEVMYEELKYIAVNPLKADVHCLDVFTKVGKSKASRKMPEFVRVGSMLDVNLMAKNSKWLSDDQADLARMRKELEVLEHPLKPAPSDRNFQKDKTLESFDLSCAASQNGVLWLASVAGIKLGKGDSLSCSLEGLTAASVDYLTICKWIDAGDWFPNLPFLQKTFSYFSKSAGGKVQKLWIVTEVLYATKLTLTGRRGLFGKVMANASALAPGVIVNLGADIGGNAINETLVMARAKRNKQFIVGYRVMKVEIGPDGKPALFRKQEDDGLRAGDDDHLARLEAMGEDVFEIDEYGGKVFVPLRTPTEQELLELRTLESDLARLDSGGSEAA